MKPKLVHALVKRLRGKLGEDGNSAAYLVNVRGVGYRMPEAGGRQRSAPAGGAAGA